MSQQPQLRASLFCATPEENRELADAFRRAGAKAEGGMDRPSISVAPGKVILSSPRELADFIQKPSLASNFAVVPYKQRAEKEGKPFSEICKDVEAEISALVIAAARPKPSAP